jgi:hypothetical protein
MLPCLLACATLGCAPADPSPGKIGRTIVFLNADGAPPTVKIDEITVEQQHAELELRAHGVAAPTGGLGVRQQGIVQDPSCAGSSLWLFDNPGNTPGAFPNNHEICFFRAYNDTSASCTPLSHYSRYCTLNGRLPVCYDWGEPHTVQSYWAGTDQGWFDTYPIDGGVPFDSVFNPYQRVDYTGPSTSPPYNFNAAWDGKDVCFFPVT